MDRVDRSLLYLVPQRRLRTEAYFRGLLLESSGGSEGNVVEHAELVNVQIPYTVCQVWTFGQGCYCGWSSYRGDSEGRCFQLASS